MLYLLIFSHLVTAREFLTSMSMILGLITLSLFQFVFISFQLLQIKTSSSNLAVHFERVAIYSIPISAVVGSLSVLSW